MEVIFVVLNVAALIIAGVLDQFEFDYTLGTRAPSGDPYAGQFEAPDTPLPVRSSGSEQLSDDYKDNYK